MINHLDLIDLCRVLYQTTAENTFFSSAHETKSIICWAIKQISTNFKRLKLYRMWSDPVELTGNQNKKITRFQNVRN